MAQVIECSSPGERVWLPLLLAASTRLIAISGSGGKTSLLYYLAQLLKRQGYNTVVSLTTKMYQPDTCGHRVWYADSADSLLQAAYSSGINPRLTTVAGATDPNDPRKLTGLPPEWFDQASKYSDCFFLIEADGSAGKPLKGYLPHEPVIPAKTSLVIPVVGLSALDKPLTDENVHRAAIAAAVGECRPGDKITIDTIVALLVSESGYRKNIPVAANTIFFLNQAESARTIEAACKIASALGAAGYSCVAGSIWSGNFSIYRQEE
jgi:probable selenium-dependent hydroxylase accessory protein YqeC